MKKKEKKQKLEKMKIETININNTTEKGKENEEDKKEKKKSTTKSMAKSKSQNKSPGKFEEISHTEAPIKNTIKYDLDFIFRRQRYILKNLSSDCLLSRIKKLINKKISVDLNLIHIYYLDKEITDDKINVYDLIKDNKIKYFEVKKEFPANENIISLNSNLNLIYKVKCKNIENAKDFIDKIDTFFREKCLDKHYLCEPVAINTYDVGFACEDNCYQFRRYMSIIKKLDNNYSNSTFEYVPFDKIKMLRPKLIDFPTLNQYSDPIYINKGPYMTYEEIKRQNEREDKKKWLCKKGFVYKKK